MITRRVRKRRVNRMGTVNIRVMTPDEALAFGVKHIGRYELRDFFDGYLANDWDWLERKWPDLFSTASDSAANDNGPVDWTNIRKMSARNAMALAYDKIDRLEVESFARKFVAKDWDEIERVWPSLFKKAE